MKILVVGGTTGFGRELCEFFGNEAVGIGRRTGHDIGKAEDRKWIVEQSLNFDIFFNHAHNGHIEGQTRLLMEVFAAWKERGKSGSIFSTGSYATYMNLKEYRRYAVIKFLHDQVSMALAESILQESLPFRLTNLRLGKLDNGNSAGGLKGKELGAWIRLLHENRASAALPNIVLTAPPV